MAKKKFLRELVMLLPLFLLHLNRLKTNIRCNNPNYIFLRLVAL